MTHLTRWIPNAHGTPVDRIKSSLPSQKGTYILVLRLPLPAHLAVGRLGTFDFPAGWYLYVGSAFGSGGLRGRLKHHFAPATKPHWHIDYLRKAAPICEVWCAASSTRYEHTWANSLRALLDATIPAPRFGASDCNCETHLFHFTEKPNFPVFCRRSAGTIQRWAIDRGDDH